MAIEVETKQWGSSIGLIIPKYLVNDFNIRTGDKLIIDIKKKENPLKELFGSLIFDKPTKQILKEIRKELEGKLI